MNNKNLDLFGNEDAPVQKKRRYKTMQEMYGTIEGKTCISCAHCNYSRNYSHNYWKCELWEISHGNATDIRLRNTACSKYVERGKDL